MSTDLIRNGTVILGTDTDDNGDPNVTMNINGEYDFTFGRTSNLVDQLRTTPLEDLQDRINGGDFFIVEDQLADWRSSQSGGFTHTDEAVGALIDNIGYTFNNRGEVILSQQWGQNEFNVPGYNQGGEFSSRLSYNWSPFNKDIKSSFDLVRLICENGMTATTQWLNTRIPLLNRWEEHLEIAHRQIQNKVENKVSERFSAMSKERASVSDLMRVTRHVQERFKTAQTAEQAAQLRRLHDAVEPQTHLGDVYHERVFDNGDVGKMVPGHLSTFDVYNIITELNSHFDDTKNSTANALNKFATELVFDYQDLTSAVGQQNQPVQAPFSDPETAFFGETETV